MVCPGGCFLWYAPSPILVYLRSPAANERSPQHTENALADLLHTGLGRKNISLLYTSHQRETVLAVKLPASLLAAARSAFASHYPGATILTGQTAPKVSYSRSLYLHLQPDVRSLRLWKEFEDNLTRTATEPISGFLEAATDRHDGLAATISFSLEPIHRAARYRAKRVARCFGGRVGNLLAGFDDWYAAWANGNLWHRLGVMPLRWFAESGAVPRDVEAKLDDHLFRVSIQLTVSGERRHNHQINKRLAMLAAAFAPFAAPGRVTFCKRRTASRSLLSLSELATLWHLPVTTSQTASMQTSALPNLPAPVELADGSEEERSVPLGTTAVGICQPAAVKNRDRMHTLIIGKSGVGKSTLMHTQIAADVRHAGVGLVDPHGDLVDDVLTTCIPRRRTNEVLILDPADPNGLTVNPLECSDESQRALIAENNLAALSKVFGFDEQSAPRLLHILRYTLLALIGTDQASYLSLRPMLVDKRFRKRIVDQVEDAEVRSFWIDEVGNWSERYEQEAMPAILNKTGQFTAHPGLRRMFGPVRGSVSIRQAMDEGKIVLVKLSQGKIGEPAARFAGSVMMAGFQNAAMTRADTEKPERRPFYLYADEYATFVNSSFADTLAQARKYGLFLTAAQQIINQVDESIMEAMFGNLATLFTFQVGQKDAERLSGEFANGATPEDLMRLPKYHAVVRTSINGVPTRPFVVKTSSPPKKTRDHAQEATIRRVLAQHFSLRSHQSLKSA